VGKPEGKRPLGRPRRRWVDNIRMDLGEVGWRAVDWIGLAQERNRWRTVVNSVLNLRVPKNAGKLSSGLSSSAQLHRVSYSLLDRIQWNAVRFRGVWSGDFALMWISERTSETDELFSPGTWGNSSVISATSSRVKNICSPLRRTARRLLASICCNFGSENLPSFSKQADRVFYWRGLGGEKLVRPISRIKRQRPTSPCPSCSPNLPCACAVMHSTRHVYSMVLFATYVITIFCTVTLCSFVQQLLSVLRNWLYFRLQQCITLRLQ
jgi:hypothetical protein